MLETSLLLQRDQKAKCSYTQGHSELARTSGLRNFKNSVIPKSENSIFIKPETSKLFGISSVLYHFILYHMMVGSDNDLAFQLK